jgi:histidyl-tRNA synthetase
MADVPFPRGVRDLLPNEALFRNVLLQNVERIFQSFGFLSIDTPTFESLKILKAKNGIGDDTRLIYEMKEDEVGLRYDFTISLARYVAMHANLPMPFKRYAIGKSWRREEPQHLRYREFTQADIDIVGGEVSQADAEVIAAPAVFLEHLNVDYKVSINDRRFIDGLLASMGVKQEQFSPILRAIDKLDKIGRDGVLKQLADLGLNRETIGKIDSMINTTGSNDQKLDFVQATIADKKAVGEMRRTLELLKAYGLKGVMEIDFSLMRGFDYYTGMVAEFKASDKSVKASIGGGGRYDNLIGILGGKKLPAVGMSLGIYRILDLLNFSDSTEHTYARAFIINVKDTNYPYALQVANALRANGIATDINLANRNISNQLSYANSLKFRYAVIIGDEEQKLSKAKLRNLSDGSETMVTVQELIDKLKQ